MPGEELEVNASLPVQPAPYSILIDANSLSACNTTMPVVSQGLSAARVSNTSLWGVMG